jgi:hypothetical protein
VEYSTNNGSSMALKNMKKWCCNKTSEDEEGRITKAIAIYKDWVVPRMRGMKKSTASSSSTRAPQKKKRKA